jgi:hypothetical protein
VTADAAGLIEVLARVIDVPGEIRDNMVVGAPRHGRLLALSPSPPAAGRMSGAVNAMFSLPCSLQIGGPR